MITSEKLWAAHCEEVRIKQKLDSDAELEHDSDPKPTPRKYVKVKTPIINYLKMFDIRKYAP